MFIIDYVLSNAVAILCGVLIVAVAFISIVSIAAYKYIKSVAKDLDDDENLFI